MTRHTPPGREEGDLYRQIAATLPGAAVFVVGPDLRYRLAEGEALHAAGLTPADLEGKTVREALPPELAAGHEAHYRAALAGGTFEVEHAAHGREYVTRGGPLRDNSGAVFAALAVSTDVTDRKRVEAALRVSEERFRAALSAYPVVVFDQDRDLRYTWIHNPAPEFTAAAVLGRTDADLLGRADDADLLATVKRAVLAGGGTRRQEVIIHLGGVPHTYDLTVQPQTDVTGAVIGVTCAAVDITDRKRVEERKAFLLALSDAIGPLADPAEVIGAACRLLRGHVGADRAYYVEVDEAAGAARVHRDSLRGDSPSLAGEYRITDFGWIIPAMRRGEMVVVPDVAASPLVPAADRAAMAAVRIAAHVNAPLVKGGVLVGALCVTDPAPRDWTPAEVELVREVGDRIWAAVERAMSEQALAAEKEYAESIVETLHEPLLVLHPDLTVKSVNPAFFTHFRVQPADTIGRKVYDLGNGQWHIPALRTLLEDVLPDSNVFNDYEVAHEFEGLGRRVMLVNGRRLDHVQLILLGIRDITEQKRAEEALRASEEKYRLLFTNMGEGFVLAEMIWDEGGGPADWRYLEVNRGWEQTGVPVEQATGRTAREVNPAIEPGWIETYGRVVKTGEPARYEAYAAGFGKWFETFAFKHSENRFALLFRDVTGRRQAEDGRRASEERLRAVAAALPGAAVFVVGPDLRYQLAAGQALAEAGFPPGDYTGRTPGEVVPPEAAAGVLADYQRALAGEPFRAEHRVGDRHFVTHGVPLRDAGGAVTAALAVSYDITDRERAEAGRRLSEARLRMALTAARMGTWTLDLTTRTHTQDENLNRLLGLPAEEAARPFDEFLGHVHPDDRAAVRAAFDGAAGSGRPLDVEFRVVRPDGAVRWLRDQGDVFGAGADARMSGACIDITDRKEAEHALRQARDELEGRVAERTAELADANARLRAEAAARADLARRLATAQEDERRRVSRDLHDAAGQTLAALLLELQAARATDPGPAGHRLDAARGLADDLARQLHDISLRLRPTVLDDLGLSAAVAQLVGEWSARTGVPAEFRVKDPARGRFPTEVETALYRVVQEALTNIARHATATAVGVTVGSRGGYATAVVEDDGRGFDPDATTPTPGRRSLGLVGMRERVALLGGTLEIESAPGHGTTVFALVPLHPN